MKSISRDPLQIYWYYLPCSICFILSTRSVFLDYRLYQQDIQKFVTFKKKSDRGLQTGDIVIITDHQGPGVSNTIGQVTELLSDRTVKLRYVQRQAKYNNEGVLIKPAKISFLLRPSCLLVYLTSPGEKFFNIDPYSQEEVATPASSSSSPAATPPSSTSTLDFPSPGHDGDDETVTPDVTNSHQSPSGPRLDGESEGGPGERNSASVIIKPRAKVTVRFIPEAASMINDIKKTRKTTKKS